MKVTGDVDVGSVEVDNFPETQDVRVTNGRSDPVPVSLDDRLNRAMVLRGRGGLRDVPDDVVSAIEADPRLTGYSAAGPSPASRRAR